MGRDGESPLDAQVPGPRGGRAVGGRRVDHARHHQPRPARHHRHDRSPGGRVHRLTSRNVTSASASTVAATTPSIDGNAETLREGACEPSHCGATQYDRTAAVLGQGLLAEVADGFDRRRVGVDSQDGDVGGVHAEALAGCVGLRECPRRRHGRRHRRHHRETARRQRRGMHRRLRDPEHRSVDGGANPIQTGVAEARDDVRVGGVLARGRLAYLVEKTRDATTFVLIVLDARRVRRPG